jgi:uncharacterized cupredoxin-like copper-binding protein
VTRTRVTVATLMALVVVAALGLAASRPGLTHAPQEIELTARYSRFTPSRITIPIGTTIRFVVHNGDPIDHEFIVGGPEVHARHELGTERRHDPKPGEVSVPIGETASTTFTFTTPGWVEFACHLPGHYRFGMRGLVHVI